MEIKDALECAQQLKRSIVHNDNWEINRLGATVHENLIPKIIMYSEDSKQFMLLLLNTFIDVHNSLSKTLEEDEDLRDAYLKYVEPFVHALQKSADEKRLINFGPTNNEPKKRTVKIDPAGETPVDDNPEESEEDIPQIVINIGELNINLNGGV